MTHQPGPALSNVPSLMEKIRTTGPSWKTDVILRRTCYQEPYRHWEVDVSDVWKYTCLPTFIGSDPMATLEAAYAYLVKFVNGGYDDDMFWVDGDGGNRGDVKNANGHEVSYAGEIYLDWPKEIK